MNVYKDRKDLNVEVGGSSEVYGVGFLINIFDGPEVVKMRRILNEYHLQLDICSSFY